jgi:aconitase A
VYRAIFEDRLVVVKVPQANDLEAQLEEYNLLARIVRQIITSCSSSSNFQVLITRDVIARSI